MSQGENTVRICVSIGRKDPAEALAQAQAVEGLADVIEIRLDCLASPVVEPFLAGLGKPLLFTNRAQWEGGRFSGSEEERIAPLVAALAAGAAYVDLELNAPAASRERLGRAREGTAGKLILSWHNFELTPSRTELVGRLSRMRDLGADMGKIVTMAHGPADSLRVLGLQEEAARLGLPLIAFAMGRAGVISRVATTELGGYMTYCAVDASEATAPGQLAAADMRRIHALMTGMATPS